MCRCVWGGRYCVSRCVYVGGTVCRYLCVGETACVGVYVYAIKFIIQEGQ